MTLEEFEQFKEVYRANFWKGEKTLRDSFVHEITKSPVSDAEWDRILMAICTEGEARMGLVDGYSGDEVSRLLCEMHVGMIQGNGNIAIFRENGTLREDEIERFKGLKIKECKTGYYNNKKRLNTKDQDLWPQIHKHVLGLWTPGMEGKVIFPDVSPVGSNRMRVFEPDIYGIVPHRPNGQIEPGVVYVAIRKEIDRLTRKGIKVPRVVVVSECGIRDLNKGGVRFRGVMAALQRPGETMSDNYLWTIQGDRLMQPPTYMDRTTIANAEMVL